VLGEHVAGEMEEGSRGPSSRVWWVANNLRRRDGGGDGDGNHRAARAVLSMACPAGNCGQPPQRTPPPLMHAGMPGHHPPQAALVRAPRSLMHGGWAATPFQTVPIAAPAIHARPFRLQDPLRLLSGRPHSCGTATGPIAPLHAELSTARVALAPRPLSTWAPREAERRRSTPGSTAPHLSD